MSADNQGFVYILASFNGVAIYIGSTNDLVRRGFEHRNQLIESHTKRYQIHKLVYYELCDNLGAAILREKRIKRWRREWKQKLITDFNPKWEDLYSRIAQA